MYFPTPLKSLLFSEYTIAYAISLEWHFPLLSGSPAFKVHHEMVPLQVLSLTQSVLWHRISSSLSSPIASVTLYNYTLFIMSSTRTRIPGLEQSFFIFIFPVPSISSDIYDNDERKNIKIISVNSKGNQPWIFSLEGLMLKLKLQYFGHLVWRADSLEKTLMLKDWKQEKEATEDEMIGLYYCLNGHESEQIPGDNKGQGSLVCCSP